MNDTPVGMHDGGYNGFKLDVGDVVFNQRQTRRQSTVDTAIDDETIQSIAIFPLSIPLIAGPGAMATSLLISKETYISVLDGFISYTPILIAVLFATIAPCCCGSPSRSGAQTPAPSA